MIHRTLQPCGNSILTGAVHGWQNFVDSQSPMVPAAGYVSQPAHAALAGQIAAALDESLFGRLPDQVIEIIGQHDAGWAEADLAALEHASGQLPHSFLRVDSETGIGAWKRSIAEAERVSPVAAFLTRKHFWLLAPRDDAAHRSFIEAQSRELQRYKAEMKYTQIELDRFTAALGFCDLLSLHLCSGSTATIRIPLAHPADPKSQEADHMQISVTGEIVSADKPSCWRRCTIGIDGWLRCDANAISSTSLHWQLS
jgi:hypothetical protein